MSQVNSDSLCSQGWLFAMGAFPLHSNPFCLHFFTTVGSDAAVAQIAVSRWCCCLYFALPASESCSSVGQLSPGRVPWGFSGAVAGSGWMLQPSARLSVQEDVPLCWGRALAGEERQVKAGSSPGAAASPWLPQQRSPPTPSSSSPRCGAASPAAEPPPFPAALSLNLLPSQQPSSSAQFLLPS